LCGRGDRERSERPDESGSTGPTGLRIPLEASDSFGADSQKMGKIINIDSDKPQKKKIEEAVRVLKRGGLVIFPTDTVYGLGASLHFARAIDRIYKVKRRPQKKPLVFLIGFKKDIGRFANESSVEVKKLVKYFWPGPLTLIFSSKKYKTIALRMPNHRIALGLIRSAGPLAATSANLSGRKESVMLSGVGRRLLEKVDLSIDGGKTPLGRVSTVLDVTKYPFRIVREGYIKEVKLRRCIKTKAGNV